MHGRLEAERQALTRDTASAQKRLGGGGGGGAQDSERFPRICKARGQG